MSVYMGYTLVRREQEEESVVYDFGLSLDHDVGVVAAEVLAFN
jgi:hypothetical protein